MSVALDCCHRRHMLYRTYLVDMYIVNYGVRRYPKSLFALLLYDDVCSYNRDVYYLSPCQVEYCFECRFDLYFLVHADVCSTESRIVFHLFHKCCV